MRNRHPSRASAAAFGLALFAGAAVAQDLGLEQLRGAAIQSMAQLNIDTSAVQYLTLEELAQIQAITGSGDGPDDQRLRIETVLRDANERIAAGEIETPTGPPGDLDAEDFSAVATLEASVSQYLARLGMSEAVDVQSLTLNQLMQMQLAQSGSDTIEEQRNRVQQIIEN